MKRKLIKKIKAKREAKKLIPKLFEKARLAYKKGNKKLYKTYSKKIKYLYMKYKIKLPKILKRQICKHCDSVFLYGKNCRVRTREHKLIIYCLECKRFTRIPLKAKKNNKNQSNITTI